MKNSNHASKALAVVLSGALAFAPAANAALDESNMAYTSAAEGFYGSLRVQYANNESDGKSNDSSVDAESSRLGVRGDVDLGGGLEAFYGFEWNLGAPANGDRANAEAETGLNTRQHHVGLRGDWGSVWAGAFDSVIVRFGGFSTTDILDQYSGNFEPIYRTGNAIAYVSPDLNGFQFGIEAHAKDNEHAINGKNDDGNDFDNIGLGASYSIQGLNFSAAYYQQQDALVLGTHANGFTGNAVPAAGSMAATDLATRVGDGLSELLSSNVDKDFKAVKADDKGQYALGISYNQDNWIVAAMYGGEDIAIAKCVNDADTYNNNTCESFESQTGDATFLSLAAGVSIDKFDFHGLWEQKTAENLFQLDTNLGATGGLQSFDGETTITALSARYHLGSKARLRAAWLNNESEVSGSAGTVTEDNTKYALGMRVDF